MVAIGVVVVVEVEALVVVDVDILIVLVIIESVPVEPAVSPAPLAPVSILVVVSNGFMIASDKVDWLKFVAVSDLIFVVVVFVVF